MTKVDAAHFAAGFWTGAAIYVASVTVAFRMLRRRERAWRRA